MMSVRFVAPCSVDDFSQLVLVPVLHGVVLAIFAVASIRVQIDLRRLPLFGEIVGELAAIALRARARLEEFGTPPIWDRRPPRLAPSCPLRA